MDKSRVLLLKIMSSVLFGSKLPDLNDVNWKDLFNEAKMQTVFLQVFNVVSPFLPNNGAIVVPVTIAEILIKC